MLPATWEVERRITVRPSWAKKVTKTLKNNKKPKLVVWWSMPIIPATLEVEVVGSLSKAGLGKSVKLT
jgi:hypothetical protein